MIHNATAGTLIKFRESAWAAYYKKTGLVNYKINKGTVTMVLRTLEKNMYHKSRIAGEFDILLDNRIVTISIRDVENRFYIISK